MQGLVMFLQNTTHLQEIKTALGLLAKVPTFICLFCSFSTYQCMISCQLKFHAWFVSLWRTRWLTLLQMTVEVLHVNICYILCET